MDDPSRKRPNHETGDEGLSERDDRMEGLYGELRTLAARQLNRQRPDHTLQPTALVHEAFMRLMRHDKDRQLSGVDLLRLAARAMRSVLVDHARRKTAVKRKGSGGRVALESVTPLEAAPAADILAVDVALEKLGELEPQWRLIVELRFFGGCTEEEIAELLHLSSRTVQRQWRMARAWLRNEIREGELDGS